MNKTNKTTKPDPMTLGRVINDCLKNLYEEGLVADTDLNCEDHLGFSPSDVERIHFHQIGYGDDVWFRLKDGRVFDAYGEADKKDPSLYDTLSN